jgi:hypothetical protein
MGTSSRVLASVAIAGILAGTVGAIPAQAGSYRWFNESTDGFNVVHYDSSKTVWTGTSGPDLMWGGSDAHSTTVYADPKGSAGGNDVFIPAQQLVETLYGGAGADTWVLLPNGSDGLYTDIIRDFDPSEGDRIDLSMMDATTKSPGRQAFRYIGEKPAFEGPSGYGAAGQLRFWNGYLIGETSGLIPSDPDDLSDHTLVVKLDGVTSLDASSLILKSTPAQLAKKRAILGMDKKGKKAKQANKRKTHKRR